jgi:hypothetical protein
VYNAPFDGAFSLRSTHPLVAVSANALPVHTYGFIRTEGHGTATHVLISNASASEWFHSGSVNSLTEGTRLVTPAGRFQLVHRVQSNRNGTMTALPVPFEERFTATKGTTTTVHLGQASSSLVSVTLLGPNYEANYLLHVWRNATNDGGAVSIVAKPRFFDAAHFRRPTFSVRKAHLLIRNTRFPFKQVKVVINVMPMTSTNQPIPLL